MQKFHFCSAIPTIPQTYKTFVEIHHKSNVGLILPDMENATNSLRNTHTGNHDNNHENNNRHGYSDNYDDNHYNNSRINNNITATLFTNSVQLSCIQLIITLTTGQSTIPMLHF